MHVPASHVTRHIEARQPYSQKFLACIVLHCIVLYCLIAAILVASFTVRRTAILAGFACCNQFMAICFSTGCLAAGLRASESEAGQPGFCEGNTWRNQAFQCVQASCCWYKLAVMRCVQSAAAQLADPQVTCGAYRACRFWWTVFLLLVVE